MPRNHDSEQATRLLQAIDAFYNNLFFSIRAAARAYSVPYITLADRLRGVPTR